MDNITLDILIQTQYHQNIADPIEDVDQEPTIIDGVVKITSGEAPALVEKAPLDIVIVLDTSGSMRGNTIANAIASVKYIINSISPADRLHLVLYSYSASVLFRNKTKADTEEMLALVDDIFTNGSTNMMDGVKVGKEILAESTFTNKHMFLFTDGMVNEGIQDSATIYSIISDTKQTNNINVSTFGLGRDYNGQLMSEMALRGSGCYYYIKSPENIQPSFSDAFNLMSTVLYKDVQLRLVGTHGSTVQKIYGYDGTTVSINNIYENNTKIYVFEVEIAPSGLPFLTVELQGVDNMTEEVVSKSFEAVATLVDADIEIESIDEIQHRKDLYIITEKQKQLLDMIKYHGKMNRAESLIEECLALLEPIKDIYSEAGVLHRTILVEKERLAARDYASIECMSPQITSCVLSSQPFTSMRSMDTF